MNNLVHFMTTFSLIDASEHDQDFIFEIFKLSMRDYIEWAWGWDEEFQRTGFWATLPVKNFKLICISGEHAGAIYVEESEQSHWIRTIFLRPEFQRLGVGSALLTQEAFRARRLNKKLILNVIKINPAKRLYDRIGFKVVDEDSKTYHMQWE
ncbi:GNAT family N-acetyltransferase [Methylomonas rosea]|uniref:GNAT family N-acetyltransferase n=1 Tax=Methylomonas rosea TaxID=2952227 RepID=A0ABT1TUU3_9GAMM|nr:GNAT family N-acetyltransferase [Methylomonas sp. WSC-7]MCQ8117843.1 GNAT family N-acetyltransferase [Methylomonas sp. WSC-7]